MSFAACYSDSSSMFLNNWLTDGKAKAGAVVLAAEEGVEDVLEVFLGDAGAGVRNYQMEGLFACRFGYVWWDVKAAAFRYGFNGIKDQVDQDLLDLDRVDH